jgi:radical SAM superfamily enzyme with C-terminal helix-hairpin-helix motif
MARVIVMDGYIDEPASLGVRPYISPHVRAVYGAARDAGAETELVTIDAVRCGTRLPAADITVVMTGCAVPGRYLRGMPASAREVLALTEKAGGLKVLGGPGALEPQLADAPAFDYVAKRDAAALVYDLLNGSKPTNRWRTLEEWNRWMILGAESVKQHPDFPEPLIAEIETYRGCVRYSSGGCSFCVEPLKGKPVYREPSDIIAETKALHALGVVNFRLGAQTCFISYQASLEEGETPTPHPEAVEELLSGVAALKPKVLHLDNANPAVIAAHPEEARLILKSIVRHCTSGNVLALGMESADPKVIDANNLNATPEQVLAAVRLINEVGSERGPTGLPYLLPGLNFIVGLDGESDKTLEADLDFLVRVRDEGLLLRRINIRQVAGIRRAFKSGVSHSRFLKFKEAVRSQIDNPMLHRLLPIGTELTDVLTELREGNRTFGRQIGTYPLLVGFNYPIELGCYLDAKVVDWGQRSVTAVEYPLDVNKAPMAALESLPSIGRKRATRLVRKRPFASLEELGQALDEPDLLDVIRDFVTVGAVR